MLGYAQVPAAEMDGLVKRLAAVIHLAAYNAGQAGAGRPIGASVIGPGRRLRQNA
jgi:GntR family transcriptional regulator/MocR family aminotransferase